MKINSILLICLPNGGGLHRKHAISQMTNCSVGYCTARNKEEILDVFSDDTLTADVIIIDGHGDNGEFVASYDWKEMISQSEIKEYFTKKNSIIISCACDTGVKELADIFVANNICYIAPDKEVEWTGDSAFVTRFIYELCTKENDITTSLNNANSIDNETACYKLFTK